MKGETLTLLDTLGRLSYPIPVMRGGIPIAEVKGLV
jgi:hypothetical protein